MVQGALKSSKSALAGGNRANGVGKKSALGPKKGQRVIKAKKEGLMRSDVLRKKHSAGLIGMTEKSLGAKAGHLELLGVGKKSKAKDAKKAAVEVKGKGNAGATIHGGEKGGTKKFG
ncbi:hypothetical protein SBOR_1156 [Sclerotinia borealis F-4128]|uniref:Uncharacterized protein n=1 Tax=Sclerotinia borealis (strain F-4128) TaxID=1432307 RepID=W9CV68_SCLBF|nr:hypothetical protein SBOR_1156 [Sclerotinia borealis F-4128]